MAIAYRVAGAGPVDLVMTPGAVSNVELLWEQPLFARFRDRIASFTRLIIFDKRGTGLSDRVKKIATLEERADDIRAVMDAAGSERAVIMGVSEGGPMAVVFAATYPGRTQGLVLYGSHARMTWAPDYQWQPTVEEYQRWIAQRSARRCRSTRNRPAKCCAASCRAPDADHIPVAGDSEAVIREIESFVADLPALEEERDTVLATVLFTDIVGSTATAAELVDRR